MKRTIRGLQLEKIGNGKWSHTNSKGTRLFIQFKNGFWMFTERYKTEKKNIGHYNTRYETLGAAVRASKSMK